MGLMGLMEPQGRAWAQRQRVFQKRPSGPLLTEGGIASILKAEVPLSAERKYARVQPPVPLPAPQETFDKILSRHNMAAAGYSAGKKGTETMMRKSALLFALGAALLCAQRGWGSEFDMRIESATENRGVITIRTTGANFQIDSHGSIRCWQRIPRERLVLEVSFAPAAGPFHIEKQDGFSCTVSCHAGTLTFQGDSLVIIRTKENIKTGFTGHFHPAYHFEKDGKWMLMDEEGGFGVYPVESKTASAPVLSRLPWGIAYEFTGGDETWLSVFPPRPFNWNRAFEPIEHDGSNEGAGAYPTNDQIADAAKYCKVLTLHAGIWQDVPEDVKVRMTPILHLPKKYAGHPQPWLSAKHVPSNMAEFIRVRDEAHRRGMKVVVYLSPYYSTAPDIFAEMQRVLSGYQVDGLYFDGISEDFRKSYAVIHRAREILGNDRILYVHCSFDPLKDGRIYCPFIDTYADYIIRGEAGVWGLKLDDFLRWTISGYNISNTVGYWCYYGSNRQQGYDANTPKSYMYFDTLPTSEHIDAALRNKVSIWRQGQEWSQPKMRDDLAAFDKEYYGKLELLRQAWEKQGTSPK
jgi:hypothetical protein